MEGMKDADRERVCVYTGRLRGGRDVMKEEVGEDAGGQATGRLGRSGMVTMILSRYY
jgi:hypothetical protein